MLAIYLLTLGGSAGLTGLFVYQVLAEQGFVPVFRAGLFLAAGIAFLYITIQTAYMLLVRIYKPTRDNPPLFFEALSHLSAVVLLPYILRMSMPWPDPRMVKVEAFIFLAAFGALHGFFKLASFFAAMRGAPGSRKGALGWLAACAVCALVAYGSLTSWVDVLEGTRPVTEEAAVARAVEGQSVMARPVQEGTQVRVDLSQEPGRGMTLLWANVPGEGAEPVERIHVTGQFEGVRGKRFAREIRLAKQGWTAVRIQPADIPPGAQACRVVWNAGEEPKWQRFSVLMPVRTSSQRLLLGGPTFWELRGDQTPSNLAVILVDGLTGHKGPQGVVNALGLGSVASLAEASVSFDNAYTPSPETAAATLSLFTGLSPLRHGGFDGRTANLPSDCSTLAERLRSQGYATAAFMDLAPEDETLTQGFDLLSLPADATANRLSVSTETQDASAPVAPAETGKTAGERASDWIKANAGAKYMVFVRVSSVGTTEGKAPDGATIRDLDKRLGALLRPLRADGRTCILLASTYGLPGRQEGATPMERLSEGGLHVPCLLYLPGTQPAKRAEVMSLEDMPAVLLKAVGGAVPEAVGSGEAVSICGDPLALSVRSGKWRFTWQTEMLLTNPSAGPGVGTAVLYDAERMRKGPTANVSARNSEAARSLFDSLQAYIKTNRPGVN